MALSERQRSRAVFIDKDGTLINDVPYNTETAKIRLMPGVVSGLKLLRESGLQLFVISNQPGIAMGLLDTAQLSRAYTFIVDLIAKEVTGHVKDFLHGFYYCPHLANACSCRKPAPGMLLRAAREHHLLLEQSWMIGDILDDVEAGHRAGCRSVLINNGNETEWKQGPLREPDAIVTRFDEAAMLIHRACHIHSHSH